MPVFFMQPCSIGSTLLVLKQLEGSPARPRFTQAAALAATRPVAIGALGMLAVVLPLFACTCREE